MPIELHMEKKIPCNTGHVLTSHTVGLSAPQCGAGFCKALCLQVLRSMTGDHPSPISLSTCTRVMKSSGHLSTKSWEPQSTKQDRGEHPKASFHSTPRCSSQPMAQPGVTYPALSPGPPIPSHLRAFEACLEPWRMSGCHA